MSLNLCQFIGRLGQDPELKYLPDGTAVVNISIACSETWKDKTTGERKEKTEWIRANAFGKQAEIIGQYFHKGSQIYISGKLQTRKWQDKEGKDNYSTEIRIEQFTFLDAKDQNTQPVSKTQANKPVNTEKDPYEVFDDYIPFN